MSRSIDSGEYSQMLAAVKAAGDEIFANSTAGTKIELIAFGSTSIDAGPFTTQAAFDAQIDAWSASRPINSSTNYTVAIQNLMDHYTPVAGQNNQVFFLSDGNPNEDTDGTQALSEPTRSDWHDLVNSASAPVHVTSVGVGNNIDNVSLQQVDVDGSGSPINVANFDDLIDTLVSIVKPTKNTSQHTKVRATSPAGLVDSRKSSGRFYSRWFSRSVPTWSSTRKRPGASSLRARF